MITFKFLKKFTCEVYVSHTVNVIVTDIILHTRTFNIHIITYRFQIIRTLQQKGTCKETTRNDFKSSYLP